MPVFKRTKKIVLLWILFTMVFSMAHSQAVEDKFKSADEIEAFFIKTRGVEKKTQLIDLVLPLEVNFTLNSAELTGRAREQLDNLAAVLLKPANKNLKLELAGHTCDLGGEQFNLNLSQRRVASASDYLRKIYGIGESRLSTIAYGESLPVIPNATSEQERSVNRRVVVYLPENRTIIEEILSKNLKDRGFQWAVFHYTLENQTRLIDYNGSTVLRSDDQYRIYIRPHKPKYVYIYQKDSHGNGEWLFPRTDIDLKNPVNPGEHYLPHRSQVFVLDDNLGKETISILAADEPVAELESILTGESEKAFPDVIDRVVKTRGLKVTRIAPPPQGPHTQEGVVRIAGQIEEKNNSQEITHQADSVRDIMTEYGEFYTEIQFYHQ